MILLICDLFWEFRLHATAATGCSWWICWRAGNWTVFVFKEKPKNCFPVSTFSAFRLTSASSTKKVLYILFTTRFCDRLTRQVGLVLFLVLFFVIVTLLLSLFLLVCYYCFCLPLQAPVKRSFECLSSYSLLKTPLQLINPVFHGNQRLQYLLIPSLLASFKTGLSEFCALKFRYFLCKEERNSKVSPRKVKTNSVHTFGQFLQFFVFAFFAVVQV